MAPILADPVVSPVVSRPVRRSWLPGGDAGVWRTLYAMRTQARQAAIHPAIRQRATDVVGADATQFWTQLRAWLTRNTRFQLDPPFQETVYTPLDQLARIARDGVAAGDCDDVATLGAAIALAAGQRARFVVVGFASPGPAAAYRHVYTEVATPQGWRDLDVTRTRQSPIPTRRAVLEV